MPAVYTVIPMGLLHMRLLQFVAQKQRISNKQSLKANEGMGTH